MRAVFLMRVRAASHGVTIASMPAGRGLTPLADVADRECRDAFPQLVVRREHPVARAIYGLETVRVSWRESLEALQVIEEMPSLETPGWEPEHELELTDVLFLHCGMLEMPTLSLSGLRRLSPLAARQLGQHKGVMIIDGLNQSTTRRPRSWAIIPALCNSTASAASLWPRGPWPAGAASGQSASHSTAAAALSRLGRLNRQITRRLARWLSAARSRGRKRPG